jgi:hypothetical protein
MGQFVRYCATEMTAHVLVKEGNKTWTWVDAPDNIEEHERIKNCRAGVLSYPPEPADWGPRIKGGMTWLMHLEYWHFTAL